MESRCVQLIQRVLHVLFIPFRTQDAFASNRPLPKPVPLDDELARIERIEIVMKDMRNDFKSLTLRIEERDAAMKGHVDSLTNDIKARDAEIITTQNQLKESESKVAAQEATIQSLVVALLQAGHSAKKQREVTLAKQADMEGRIRARDKELEMTRAKLDDADNTLAQRDEEFHDSLDDAQTKIEEGIDWSDDLDALVDDKNRVIEDMKVKSRDEIDLLKAHILELEGQVIASFRDSRPVTLQATTLVPLDINDSSSINNSPVSPMCNLPQDVDYFEHLAPELAYENPKAEVDMGPNPELVSPPMLLLNSDLKLIWFDRHFSSRPCISTAIGLERANLIESSSHTRRRGGKSGRDKLSACTTWRQE